MGRGMLLGGWEGLCEDFFLENLNWIFATNKYIQNKDMPYINLWF